MKLLSHCLAIVVAGLIASTSSVAEPNVVLYSGEGSEDTWCGPRDDQSILVVRDGKLELAQHRYCSSYGPSSSSATIYTDVRGTIYILLLHAEGRGTCASQNQYLSVLGVDSSLSISEYASVPRVSWPSDVNCTTEGYDINAVLPEVGGLQVELVPPGEGLDHIMISVRPHDS